MEKIPITILLVLSLSLEVPGNAGETFKWFKDGCSNYTFHVKYPRTNWEESRELCKKTGPGDLVSIESDTEWIFLKNTILKLTIAKEYFIGLKKDEQSGEWKWLSNKSTVTTSRKPLPWAPGEPNRHGDCAVMYKDYLGYGKYNDLPCTKVPHGTIAGYICELPIDGCDQEDKESTTKPATTAKPSTMTKHSTTTKPSMTQSSTRQPTGPTSRDPSTIAKAREGVEQAYDKDNCSSVVTILASLVAVLSAALLMFVACFLSWRKKQRKDARNATVTGNTRDDQDGSSLSPENVARHLGFSDRARPGNIDSETRKRQTEQSSRQESGYTMLTPRTIMMAGDSSYASLVKSEKGDCVNEFSVVASRLLQLDEESHDELPTYVNQMRSSEYMNI